MNMQISPASTHAHQLRDPLIHAIGYKVVCGPRNTAIVFVTAVLKREYSAMVLT